MSIRLTPRPRLPSFQVCPRFTFSRGIRLPKKSVGNDVNVWLKGPGSVYEYPINGPNWLSGNKTFVSRHPPLSICAKYNLSLMFPLLCQPFPMNPSFKPPAPISDKTKSDLYALYMRDPAKNNVRALSELYGISLKRVDAILRLKGMEQSWVKVSKNNKILPSVLVHLFKSNDESKTISL